MNDFSEYYSQKTSDIDDLWFLFTQIQFDWILARLQKYYARDDVFFVMDLGCGTGRLLSMIAEEFPNAVLYGVDGTPEMVRQSISRLRDKAVIIQANLNDYVPPRQYDVIISTTVLHHLDNPSAHIAMIKNHANYYAFVSEISISTLSLFWANMWWSMTQKSHKRAWTPRKFKTLIKYNGLNINDTAILKPDNFWRIQIYDLSVPSS